MSTLLIGGNGLIGTRLSAYLADHGEEVFSYSLHLPCSSSSKNLYSGTVSIVTPSSMIVSSSS